jgi:hypothetical protein
MGKMKREVLLGTFGGGGGDNLGTWGALWEPHWNT